MTPDEIAYVLAETFPVPDYESPWELLAARDHYVYVTQTRLAKVTRTPSATPRLANGVITARELTRLGAPVVDPLLPLYVPTRAGNVTLWPRLTHTPPPSLTESLADALGQAIAATARHRTDHVSTFNPLARAYKRLEISTFSPHLIALAEAALHERWTTLETLRQLPRVFAHGDIHLENVLFTSDGPLLIDFDYATTAPLGWDAASLARDLILGYDDPAAFADTLDGYYTAGAYLPSTQDFVAQCVLKELLTITFAMTFAPTQDAEDQTYARLSDLPNLPEYFTSELPDF